MQVTSETKRIQWKKSCINSFKYLELFGFYVNFDYQTFVIDLIQTPSNPVDLGNTSLDTANKQFKELINESREYG